MTPFKAPPDYPRWAEVAALIHDAFAYMAPILGHPARAADVTADQLAEAADDGAAYLVEDASRPIACLFTRRSRDFPDALYVGWLAVAEAHRGAGLAAALMAAAEAEARRSRYPALTLDTGRALVDLHSLFHRMGFADLPGDGEIISFRKNLAPGPQSAGG